MRISHIFFKLFLDIAFSMLSQGRNGYQNVGRMFDALKCDIVNVGFNYALLYSGLLLY